MKYPQLYEEFNRWASIPKDQWLNFESKLIEKSFKKGEFLLQPGDSNLEFGIILNGIFRLFYTDKDGKEQIKAFRRDGELCGPYAEMLLNIPSRTFIQAMENSKMVLINKNDFFPFYERHPCWATLGRIVAEKQFVAKEQREFEFLQMDVWERYQQFCQDFGPLIGKIPQHQIASYLGVTPVALSRVLSRERKNS